MTSAYHHVYFCHFSNKLTQKNTLKKKSKYLTQQLTSVRSLGIVNWLQTRKTILFQVKFLEKSVNKVDAQVEEQLWVNQSPLVRSITRRVLRQWVMYFWRWRVLDANLFISLAESEEQMNFSQQSPKMLKIATDIFIHIFLLFLGLFLKIFSKIFRWVPLRVCYTAIFSVVTQRSSPLTAAEKKKTFLSLCCFWC